MAWQGGHITGEPVDILLNQMHDLYAEDGREHALNLIETYKPRFATFAFPCTPSTTLQNLNESQGRYEHLEQRVQDWVFLDFVKDGCIIQAEGCRGVLGENPKSAKSWETDPMRALIDDPRFTVMDAEQCMWGRLRSRTGNLHKKPTRFLVRTGSSLACWLNKSCVHTADEHQPIIGEPHISRDAGKWPRDLCQDVVSAVTLDALRTSSAPRLRWEIATYKRAWDADTKNEVIKTLILAADRVVVTTWKSGEKWQMPVTKPLERMIFVSYMVDDVEDVQDVWMQDGTDFLRARSSMR